MLKISQAVFCLVFLLFAGQAFAYNLNDFWCTPYHDTPIKAWTTAPQITPDSLCGAAFPNGVCRVRSWCTHLSKTRKKKVEDEFCYAQKKSDWQQCDEMKDPLKRYEDIPPDIRERILVSDNSGWLDVTLYCPALPKKSADELGKCPPPEVCKKTTSSITSPVDTDTATEDELKAACYPGFPCHRTPAPKPKVNKSNPI
jgi:hypothetical protein